MSDTNDDTDLTTPADLLVKMTELGARAQGALLQAEMDALAKMMTGLAGGHVAPATDAEVESGFDNMPV